jgi:hypothetical protein
MFPSRSSLPALTAFARPGPGANRSPTSSLLFGHRTPSASSAPALTGRPPVFPWASLPRVDASSACPTALAVTPADRASVPVGASVAGLRSTLTRFPPRKAEGLPRLLGCPLPTCRSPTSRRSSASSPYRSTEMLRSGGRSPSAPAYWSFRDCNPAARILACLHINRPITGTAARLGYRPAG